MAKGFEFDARKCSVIDQVSGIKGTLTVGDGGFRRTDKGIALRCNGVTNILYNKDLLNKGSFSITCIFKGNKTATFIRPIKSNANPTSLNWSILTDSQSRPLLILNGSCYKYFNADTRTNDGRWHLAIVTLENYTQSGISEAKMYIDGDELTGGFSLSNSAPLTSDVDVVAGSTNGNSDILDVETYDHVLTTEERNQLYKEFLRSTLVQIPKRDFRFPKPTDLSSEVDGKLSVELITNGGFDANTDWDVSNPGGSTGWIIEDGVAKCNTDGALNGRNLQQSCLESGKKYKLTFDVLQAGSLNIYYTSALTTNVASTIGKKEIEFISDGGVLVFFTPGSSSPTIDNVSLKEIQGLVAAYSFSPETVSKGQLLDISGNGNHGTINGAMLTNDGMKLGDLGGYIDTGYTLSSSLSEYSINLRCKLHKFGTERDFIRTLTDSSGNRFGVLVQDGNVYVSFFNGIEYNGKSAQGVFNLNTETSITAIVENGTFKLYVDGVEYNDAYEVHGLFGSICGFIGKSGRSTDDPSNFTISDLKEYNYALSKAEVIAYHNSFVKPYLIETFENEGADGIVKLPRGWSKGTGSFKIEEYAISNGNLVFGGTLAADGGGNSASFIEGGVNFSSIGISTSTIRPQIRFENLQLNHKYKIKAIPTIKSGNTTYSFYDGNTYIIPHSAAVPIEEFEVEFTCLGTVFFALNGQNSFDVDWEITLVEVAPLDFKSGTKGTNYQECVTEGTIAIPSKWANGVCEFDFYKGGDDNIIDYKFISDDCKGASGGAGYQLRIFSNEALYFQKVLGGQATLFNTAISYIKNFTFYRIRLERTAEGKNTLYIKGGDFGDNFQLIGEAIDNSYKSSNYLVIYASAGDMLANIKMWDGIKQ